MHPKIEIKPDRTKMPSIGPQGEPANARQGALKSSDGVWESGGRETARAAGQRQEKKKGRCRETAAEVEPRSREGANLIDSSGISDKSWTKIPAGAKKTLCESESCSSIKNVD